MSPERDARPRPPSGPSLPALAAAAAGLALAGFLAGAGAGLLWEAPGLVTAHLLGRSEAVPLAADPAPEEAPADPGPASGGERSPLGARAEEAAGAPPVSARREAAEEAAREGSGASDEGEEGGFVVQVGAFAEEATARELATRLRAAGFPVYVRGGDGGGAARHRVRVGPLGSRAEAERAAERLERERELPTWILSREGE